MNTLHVNLENNNFGPGTFLKNNLLTAIERWNFKTGEMEGIVLHKDLIESHSNLSEIYYADYLRTIEWEAKRRKILHRDKYNCQKCHACITVQNSVETPFGEVMGHWDNVIWEKTTNVYCTYPDGSVTNTKIEKPTWKPSKSYHLEVHHKKYILNRLPWQYDDEDLIALCDHCHKDVHEKEQIPIYNELGQEIVHESCTRCSGAGFIPYYSYHKGGICFECGGARFNIRLIG